MFNYLRRPENVPRLFDLIKVKDEKVKTAFYFALKDTLVGKDLEQATRISDKVILIVIFFQNKITFFNKLVLHLINQDGKRWRVVTLQGQLVEQSGMII